MWIWKSLSKFVLHCFTKSSIRITAKFHVLLKWNPNNKIKFAIQQKQNLWFSTTKYFELYLLPKIICLTVKYFSLQVPSLGSPKSHHHDSKPTRIQNSNPHRSTINPYPKCFVHPKPCNHPTPLTNFNYNTIA